MKKGLVSTLQIQNSFVRYYLSSGLVTTEGTPLGPLIVDVVDPVDEYDISTDFYWVDVPDTTVSYRAYYDTATSTPVELTFADYWVNAQPLPGDSPLATRVVVCPATDPQPANTTSDDPGTGPAGSTLYWWTVDAPANQWAWSFFDPNEYSTLVTAVPYLKGLRITPYAVAALNNQLRAYTPQVLQTTDLTTLDCADYPVTYGVYYADIVLKEQAQENIVEAATTLSELFPYNPEGWSTAYP